MHLLDTSILVEIIRGTPMAEKIEQDLAWRELMTTSVSAYELLRGFNSPKTIEFLEKFIILEFNKQAAVESAKIYSELKNKGQMINNSDIMIAGIVKANQGRLYTLDKDFSKISSLDAKIY